MLPREIARRTPWRSHLRGGLGGAYAAPGYFRGSGGATPPQDINYRENLYAYRLYHICLDIFGTFLLYMLEPQYLAIYTCCDKVKLGAEHAEYNLLVSLPFRFHITPPQFREPYKTSLWELKKQNYKSCFTTGPQTNDF